MNPGLQGTVDDHRVEGPVNGFIAGKQDALFDAPAAYYRTEGADDNQGAESSKSLAPDAVDRLWGIGNAGKCDAVVGIARPDATALATDDLARGDRRAAGVTLLHSVAVEIPPAIQPLRAVVRDSTDDLSRAVAWADQRLRGGGHCAVHADASGIGGVPSTGRR